MATWGLRPEDYPVEPTYVWPDNWRSVLFAIELGNGSWNMGPKGPVGYRPEAFREARQALRVTAAEWPALLHDLRVIEAAELAEIHKD
jgi:hypothetical protein